MPRPLTFTFASLLPLVSFLLATSPSLANTPSDPNHDGVINQLDLNIVIGNWQKTGMTSDQGDINTDGVVNQLDANSLIANWQKTGEPSGVSYAPLWEISTGDLNGDGVVNQLDLNIITGNWMKTGLSAYQGDINNDGIVNQLDLNFIIGNWQKTSEPSGVSSALLAPSSLLPEPSSLAALALLPLLSQRRRSTSRRPRS